MKEVFQIIGGCLLVTLSLFLAIPLIMMLTARWVMFLERLFAF